MRGHVTNELDVALPADDVWAVYSSPDLPRLIIDLQPGVFEKIDILKGDGRVGTVLHVILAQGIPGPRDWEEKFTVIDHEKRIKIVRQIKRGFLDIGFSLHEVHFEIIPKDACSCFIRNTLFYEVAEDSEANASMITANSFWGMAKSIAKYALDRNGNKKTC